MFALRSRPDGLRRRAFSQKTPEGHSRSVGHKHRPAAKRIADLLGQFEPVKRGRMREYTWASSVLSSACLRPRAALPKLLSGLRTGKRKRAHHQCLFPVYVLLDSVPTCVCRGRPQSCAPGFPWLWSRRRAFLALHGKTTAGRRSSAECSPSSFSSRPLLHFPSSERGLVLATVFLLLLPRI